jgi:hypothetical protein
LGYRTRGAVIGSNGNAESAEAATGELSNLIVDCIADLAVVVRLLQDHLSAHIVQALSHPQL